jgi:hypothetical protein
MPPQLERGMQWLTAESARILHTLRHIDADDATEVLRALWRVRGLLDGLIESAHMLWTWQDLFKVWHRIAVVVVTIYWHNSIFSRPSSNDGVYAC